MDAPAAALDLLLVEDDPVLREVLALHLRGEGWTVRETGDGAAALGLCAERLPDVAVLDVMLPGRSGIELCAALRALYQPSPGVILVTARASEADVVLGLEVGADDYVVKPCRPREVVARVRALARRLAPPPPPPPRAAPVEVLERGPLRINIASRRVSVGRSVVRLTPMEFELLAFLARAPERVFSRGQLLQSLWDVSNEGYERNVDCHVTRVRKKLEGAGLSAPVIETVHGVGYCFVLPAGG